MKKNSLNIFRLTALALIIALALSGCDFAAKNLAKQTQDAAKQMAELQEKAAELEEKAAALSPKDRQAFQAELERLGVKGAPEWLYNDEAALLTGAPEVEEEARGGIIGLLGGLFGGGGSRDSGASSGSGGTFTLTGIPSRYNGKYAFLMGGLPVGDWAIVGARTVTGQENKLDMTFTPIQSGRAVLNLYTMDVNRYKGSDTYLVGIAITGQASAEWDDDPTFEAIVTFENISFRNGSASKAWGDGEVEEQ
jgi:hypothetical protein